MTEEQKKQVSKRSVIIIAVIVVIIAVLYFGAVVLWHGLPWGEYDHQPMDKQTWPHLTASASTIFLDTPVSIQASHLQVGTLYSIYLNYNPLYAFTAEEERWVFTRTFQLEECIAEDKELYVELYLIEWDPVKIWDHLRINIEEVNG